MSPELVFALANAIALLAWLLLVVLPDRKWVTDLVTGRAVPALFAGVYVAIVLSVFPGAAGSFATLDGVALLFSNRWLLLAGWLHYLAFDLLIGTWQARDARANGLSRTVLIPILFVTFMFGPAGWLSYVAVKAVRNGRPV
jgi:hypothetical protein